MIISSDWTVGQRDRNTKIYHYSVYETAGIHKYLLWYFMVFPRLVLVLKCLSLYTPPPGLLPSLWARLPTPHVLHRLRGWGATQRNQLACWPVHRCPTAAAPPPHGRPGTARHTKNVEISTWINIRDHFCYKSISDASLHTQCLDSKYFLAAQLHSQKHHH